jgi:hypothetical protein
MRVTDSGGLAVMIGLPLGKRAVAKTNGNGDSGGAPAVDFKEDA